MIRPQRNVKFLPQTEKWFVGDGVFDVPALRPEIDRFLPNTLQRGIII